MPGTVRRATEATLRISSAELASRLGDWNQARTVLYRALAGAVERLIREGQLAPGTRLPAGRSLAIQLNLSRGTVMAAYDLLREGDLVATLHGSGTVVRRDASPVSGPREAHLTMALPQESLLNGVGATAAGHIDLRSASWVGADAVGSIAAERLQRRLVEAALEGRYDRLGSLELRTAVAAHLSHAGLPTGPEELLITTGAQQGISLTVQLYVGPGDAVVVEDPTYPGAVEAMVAQQARIARVAIGPAGPELPLLCRSVERVRPRLVYLVPSVHNPTGVVMPALVRQRLVELIAGWDAVVVDDTTLAETQIDGVVPAPLAAYADERAAARIITVGSLSKSLWDGLRVGWVRATPTAIDRLARLKSVADLGTPRVTQVLAEEVLRTPDALFEERRRALRHRRDLLSALLARHLPEWSWSEPAGGLCLWVDTGRPDAAAFCALAGAYGVDVIPSTVSSATTRFPSHLRIPYAHPPEVLEEAVRRLSAAWSGHRRTAVLGQVEEGRAAV